jgi:integrase
MKFENLFKHCEELITYMKDTGYAKSYIRLLTTEINWLKNHDDSTDSYEQACSIRERETDSKEVKRRYRLEYGILKRFDEYGIYPDYRRKEPLVKRAVFYQLCPEFQDVINRYKETDLLRGLKPHTVNGNTSGASNFLYAMQKRNIFNLHEIKEEDAMSFFTDSSGKAILSSGYKKNIAQVFKAELGKYTADAKRVAAFLPCIRPKRKNIQYLQAEETAKLHDTLEHQSPSELSLRDRAIGTLLYYTGLRGCDISNLTFDDIDWEKEMIHIVQQKTASPLDLPLTPVIGNAIYDYATNERPDSDDPHIFLAENLPHDPIAAGTIWWASARLYKAAKIRQSKGDCRGTHLFRHNVATTLVSNGIPRPVASAVLGHENPNSLDHYTSADIKHLRTCALSIGEYLVAKEVFEL